MTTNRNWRRTPLNLLDGQVEMLRDDWSLAHIYFEAHGPYAGRWGWFMHIAPDGTPYNRGTGTVTTGSGAQR